MINEAPVNNEPVNSVDLTTTNNSHMSVVGVYVLFADFIKILLKKAKEVVNEIEGVTIE